MQKLLIATTNKGKFHEIKQFLLDVPLELVSLSDVHITTDYEETGDTYEENSLGKALFYAKLSGLPTVSDDGGFEIAAMGGAPGIKSKRWVGEHATEKDIVDKMMQLSKELPKDDRGAKFVAVVTFAMPDGTYWQVRQEIHGIIPMTPHMPIPQGLPYRSFFYLPELHKYYHELTPEEIKEYNHRYKAITSLKKIIKEQLKV